MKSSFIGGGSSSRAVRGGAAIISAVLIVGLAACSSAKSKSSASPTGAGTAAGSSPATAAGSAAPAGATASGACDPKDVHLIQSGRGLENEYYVAVDAGAKKFAQDVGLSGNYQWIASEGSSSKQLAQITSLLAKYGKCTVLNVDANDNSIVPAIIKAVDASGAWLVTQWNKPDGISPTNTSPHWVAHMSVSGIPDGDQTAEALFKAMGGKGNIVALEGILDNVPAKERFAGLQQALKKFPDIHLLEAQTANWDRTQAQNLTQTFLTKYGSKITGVWAANDDMALGAISALKTSGKVGKVLVASAADGLQESITDIKAGNLGYVATSASLGSAQGYYGLAIGYAAATGKIDVAKEPASHRAFNFASDPIIDASTVGSIPAPTSTTGFTPDGYWSIVGSTITN